MNKPQETPGPWQREPGPFGRRYRMEKGVKCYEMTVNGVPQSQLEEYNRRQREEQAQKVEAAQRKAAQIATQRRIVHLLMLTVCTPIAPKNAPCIWTVAPLPD